MTESKVITVWERLNEKSDKWEHNHISDGFVESQEKSDAVNSTQKKGWSQGKWRKFKAQLIDNRVVTD